MIVVVAGLPGTGKSVVAGRLAAHYGAVHLSVDPIEDAMLGCGLPRGWETGVAAYEAARVVAEQNLALGRPVVVDAVCDSEPARETWRTAARAVGVPVAFLLAECSDQVEHRRRLESRKRPFAHLPEPTWAEVVERAEHFEPWAEPPPVVDTARPLEETVAQCLAYTQGVSRSSSPVTTND